jgi:uncharacterized protein YfbU (UPF0304 family)
MITMPSPVERLILLNLYRIKEMLDPTNAVRWDRDAESCELGTPVRIAELFDEQIDLDPTPATDITVQSVTDG